MAKKDRNFESPAFKILFRKSENCRPVVISYYQTTSKVYDKLNYIIGIKNYK